MPREGSRLRKCIKNYYDRDKKKGRRISQRIHVSLHQKGAAVGGAEGGEAKAFSFAESEQARAKAIGVVSEREEDRNHSFEENRKMILDDLSSQLKDALKAKDDVQASTIRMLVSALHNKEIELHGEGQDLTDADALDVLKKELKKRKEAALAFEQADRKEMAEKEKAEAAYIETLLPPQLSDEEILVIIDEVFAEIGEVSSKDFGKVMKEVMAKNGGAADGGTVSRFFKGKLG